MKYSVIPAFAALSILASCAPDHAGGNHSSSVRSVATRSQVTTLPAADLARVQRYFERKIPGYMEGTSQPIEHPGWQGYPTKLHHYRTSDGKSAKVIMCNADANRLARWVVSACLESKGRSDAEITDKLAKHIISQSGAQFPVAGIVYEDMDGKGNALFAFRDGVTCTLPGIANGDRRQVLPEEQSVSLDPGTQIIRAGKYARIASTTREDYKAAGGTRPTSGTSWPATVRQEYQAALRNDRNLLIVAWAKAHL